MKLIDLSSVTSEDSWQSSEFKWVEDDFFIQKDTSAEEPSVFNRFLQNSIVPF